MGSHIILGVVEFSYNWKIQFVMFAHLKQYHLVEACHISSESDQMEIGLKKLDKSQPTACGGRTT